MEAKTEKSGEPNEDSGQPAHDRPGQKGIRNVIIICLVMMAMGVAVWLAIVLLDVRKQQDSMRPKSAEELALEAEKLAREKELRADEAEKVATWQNYHCNLMYRYYDGSEPDLPLAELLGLDKDADDTTIRKRCKELLSTVRLLGGWPTSQPQQDNIVVCDGFRFILEGQFNFSILPTRRGLRKNEVSYNAGTDENLSQRTVVGQPTAVGRYGIIIVQADDRCIVVATQRVGRFRKIAGRIVRAE